MAPDDDKTRTHVTLTGGTMVSHYRIIEKIGAGGMGEVYLAEDTRLKRKVALKFLPSHLVSNEEIKTRFLREAQAVAKLNHPNIVTIYDVSEFNGRPFFAMEHVEGVSLRDLLQREMLDFGRVIELIIGLCDGLQAAHNKGVVHRDIKPANIVIDGYGKPKVLDFGLAAVRDTEQLTRAGSTMGTLQYMSPEQTEGKIVDARSDLFSLGVVFYELIAGRSPFARDSETATIRAIVTETPEPLARYRAGVSSDLQRVVSRLLERDPSRRYQTAADAGADLRSLNDSVSSRDSRPPVQEESIVVVPFENLGGDPENEYFSDGLTEEVITDLGKLEHVRVISRKSSMLLKGTKEEPRVLGNRFNVRYLLTGSVRRSQQNLRVNAELMETANDRQIWAERYTGTMQDVFDIQEQIARSIAATLRVKLGVSEERALAERSVKNPQVYDLLLRARHETERWSREGLDRAQELLLEALKLEPESAILYAALGYNYYNYVNLGFHQDESIARAFECVRKAFELDAESIDALRLQGIIQISLTGEGRIGLQSLERVLEISPQDTEAMLWISVAAGLRGRYGLGVKWAQRLVTLEPFVSLNYAFMSWSYYLDGDIGRALEASEAAYRKDPNNSLLQFTRVQLLLYSGRVDEAIQQASEVEKRSTLSIFDRMILIQVYAAQGRRDKVDELLTEECIASARRDLQYPWHIAVALTMLGDRDSAIEWLRIAVKNGFANYRLLEELDPYLEPLRTDPRFKEVVDLARAESSTGE
jgi:non-specific serine/threonine protein kinase